MSRVMEFYVRSKARKENLTLSREERGEIEERQIRRARFRRASEKKKTRIPLRDSPAQRFFGFLILHRN